VPRLAPAYGVPPDLVRASLDVALAELALRSQERALLPTVQAGYTFLFDDDGGSLTLGLESRTLQPSLSYSLGSGGGTTAGAGIGGIGGIGDVGGEAGAALPTLRGAFSISVSWTISLGATLERDAARATLLAAAEALALAHDRLRGERDALEGALEGADEALSYARLALDLALHEERTIEARLEAGIVSPLEVDAARLSVRQAELDLQRAEAQRLSAVLDFYTAFALPLSEVLP
jgi:outer membrane protein